MVRKRKNKLVVEPFDDIKIIGINTGMIDYQLAWNLNKSLKFNFIKYKNITSNGDDFFSFYLYDAGENSNTYNLVALSSSEGKARGRTSTSCSGRRRRPGSPSNTLEGWGT